MAAEFRLLGAVEVRLDGRLVDVGHARQQCVLAVLLHDANRSVSADQLVDRVWGDRRLPDRPQNTLQTYVSLLRRALVPLPRVDIRSRPGGYLLAVDANAVDLHRFHDLLGRARTADGDEQAAALFEQALGLWRGEPFASLDTPWLASVRARLTGDRHAAELDLTDLQLRLGRHAALQAALADRVREHPLDERVVGQLMLALYRNGRPADALDTYRQAQRRFAEELGTDPSPPLRELHQRILAADPDLSTPVTKREPPRPPARSVVPRQLPVPPRLFTGRTRELARLAGVGQEPADTMAISAICGAGGIGKTWLALYWAHHHVDEFPDGQLYVNLRGFDPSGAPTTPAAAVRGFLDALGVHPSAVPQDLDGQAALYRSLVADKRLLILLDNARDTAQVVPLLPGSPSCLVLVTSRQRLTDLITRHGAGPIDLDVLSRPEARDLLTRHLGHQRVETEAVAVAELLDCCAGLPLAIGVVAARAAIHPHFSLAVLAEELRDASSRLDGLDGGDLTTNLRTVLSWSYHVLDADVAAMFRLLGLVPTADIGLRAAAWLAALPTDRARMLLRELENAHLVQQYTPGRYRMHDLVRLYAGDRVRQDHPPADQVTALRGLVDSYRSTAFSADRLLDAHRLPVRLGEPADARPASFVSSRPTALAWFVAEHATLIAVQRLAAEQGWHELACQLAWTLETFHRQRGQLHDAVAVWQVALAAADVLVDPVSQAVAHRQLGLAKAKLGAGDEALDHLNLALGLAERTEDVLGQAHAHHLLACAWELQSDDERALAHARHALPLFQKLDLPVWEAWALDQVGWHEARLGDYQGAHEHCEAALALARRHHDREGEAVTLDSLGYVAHQNGEYPQAVDYYQQALALFRDLDHAYEEASTLEQLAHTQQALGQLEPARATWQHALDLCQSQHRIAEAQRIQRRLGEIGSVDQHPNPATV
jgi:DNA-binding SARP family transcriptional activator